MKHFKILTLVDITETGQYRIEANRELEQYQQQNFMVMLQTIGMRANPVYSNPPVSAIVNLKDYEFGSVYNGLHKIWTFNFSIETQDVFCDTEGNETGLLEKDFHFVPIITKLRETAGIKLPLFDSASKEHCNIIVLTELDK